MESALRPREIQARVRAGESLEEVAAAAGVPVERIEAFAGPVLAERAYIAGLALEAHVRRQGEATSSRTLLAAVTERLSSRGVERGDVTWDSWKLDGRRWHVQADFETGSTRHRATFAFDLDGRFSIATNKDARWLIDDEPTSARPARRPRSEDPDSEPTLDLDDELALVRAVDVERDPYEDPTGDPDETGDAYTPGDLAEIDGVYDIVPPKTDMDVLYDMLATFNEDSVQIYRGLTRPLVVGSHDAEPTGTDDTVGADADADADDADAPLASSTDADTEDEPPAPGDDADEVATSATSTTSENEAEPTPDDGVAETPKSASAVRSGAAPDTEPVEPEQPALGEAPEASPPPRKSPPRRSRRRASVPSWDEIMFGAPTPPKDKG